MNDFNNFIIIGGDKRQQYAAQYLQSHGCCIKTFALPDCNIKSLSELKNEIGKTDAVILPLPLSKDGKNLNTISDYNKKLDEIISAVSSVSLVFGGMIDRETEYKLKKSGARVFDYFSREDVTAMNCVPTSQGVLKVILDNIDYTVRSARCAVFGFGRTGKVIASDLHSLGACVTVCARKDADIALAKALGYNSAAVKDFIFTAPEYDIIINTVPAMVITSEIIKKLNKNCLIIDIASAPFGTDFSFAEKVGIKALQCPSLPGKTAPKTAGKIIADGILSILKEEGYAKL